jgi:hypothetical protein
MLCVSSTVSHSVAVRCQEYETISRGTTVPRRNKMLHLQTRSRPPTCRPPSCTACCQTAAPGPGTTAQTPARADRQDCTAFLRHQQPAPCCTVRRPEQCYIRVETDSQEPAAVARLTGCHTSGTNLIGVFAVWAAKDARQPKVGKLQAACTACAPRLQCAAGPSSQARVFSQPQLAEDMLFVTKICICANRHGAALWKLTVRGNQEVVGLDVTVQHPSSMAKRQRPEHHLRRWRQCFAGQVHHPDPGCRLRCSHVNGRLQPLATAHSSHLYHLTS